MSGIGTAKRQKEDEWFGADNHGYMQLDRKFLFLSDKVISCYVQLIVRYITCISKTVL